MQTKIYFVRQRGLPSSYHAVHLPCRTMSFFLATNIQSIIMCLHRDKAITVYLQIMHCSLLLVCLKLLHCFFLLLYLKLLHCFFLLLYLILMYCFFLLLYLKLIHCFFLPSSDFAVESKHVQVIFHKTIQSFVPNYWNISLVQMLVYQTKQWQKQITGYFETHISGFNFSV